MLFRVASRGSALSLFPMAASRADALAFKASIIEEQASQAAASAREQVRQLLPARLQQYRDLTANLFNAIKIVVRVRVEIDVEPLDQELQPPPQEQPAADAEEEKSPQPQLIDILEKMVEQEPFPDAQLPDSAPEVPEEMSETLREHAGEPFEPMGAAAVAEGAGSLPVCVDSSDADNNESSLTPTVSEPSPSAAA